jgi:hypothetical protein
MHRFYLFFSSSLLMPQMQLSWCFPREKPIFHIVMDIKGQGKKHEIVMVVDGLEKKCINQTNHVSKHIQNIPNGICDHIVWTYELYQQPSERNGLQRDNNLGHSHFLRSFASFEIGILSSN